MPWRPLADLRALLELAAPSGCGGCGAAGTRWCEVCATILSDTAPRPWRPTPCPPGMPPTWAGPAYDEVVRAAVVAWKEQDRVDLGPPLAAALRRSVEAALDGSPAHRAALGAGAPVAVLPAPSARRSTRARGRAPVVELAAGAVGRDAVLDILRLTRTVRDQAGLGAAERAANLAGAVRLRPGSEGRIRNVPCVVVDDVVTTGATLVECARALRCAGAGPVVAATVAATERRATRRSTPLPSTGGAD